MISVRQDEDGSWVAEDGMAINGDGSPRCYAPLGSGLESLDYLANAGARGNWWGIVCDPHGTPYIQGDGAPAFSEQTKGFYVSTTTYERRQFPVNDCRRYLNSETESFIVVPSHFRRSVPGIAIGCRCIVTYKGLDAAAVVGDVGPDFGEGSIALASRLNIPSNPKTGGVLSGVTFRIFPGVPANVNGTEYQLQPA